MIFPLLNGILSMARAPITWILFFINLVVFVVTFTSSEKSQGELESYLKDEAFSRTQGVVFARFIESHSSRYPASMQYLAQKALHSKELDKRSIMGGMAMRDSLFLREADNFRVPGDQVAFGWWHEKFKDLTEVRDLHPSYSLGLTQNEDGFLRWITYQFAHSGVSHFVGNMIFFLIFASSLEVVIGSLGLLVVYLASGICAALMFISMNEASAIPLIGASGAISGLMAFFSVMFWNRGVRYAFFLLVPRRGFAGLVYLPAWLTLILWMLSDVAGHWATPSELGGIAYSAHLGGELSGVIMALSLIGLRHLRGQPLLPEKLPFETKPIFTRYV
jgi:membrane associated rhomboid family serine protease